MLLQCALVSTYMEGISTSVYSYSYQTLYNWSTFPKKRPPWSLSDCSNATWLPVVWKVPSKTYIHTHQCDEWYRMNAGLCSSLPRSKMMSPKPDCPVLVSKLIVMGWASIFHWFIDYSLKNGSKRLKKAQRLACPRTNREMTETAWRPEIAGQEHHYPQIL